MNEEKNNHGDEEEVLMRLAERIVKAAEKGKGCRISAKEANLLQFYNLPCTAEDSRLVAS